MGTISNKFIVTALQDGQTITGAMSTNRSLWQSINKSTGVPTPNWYDANKALDDSSRPCLTPVLMSGGTQITPTTITWKYNGVTMTFATNHKCLTPSAAADKFYQKDNSLIIIDNIASTTNDDSDVITATGTAVVGDATLNWETMETIRITESGTSSTVGEIVCLSGRAYITSDEDSINLQAVLHDNSGTVAMTDYKTEWYLNNSSTVWRTTYNAESQTVALTGSDSDGVLDYTIVRADFYKKVSGSNTYETDACATAFIGIDDLSDDEVMQMAYAIHASSASATTQFLNNTTTATLKTGQAVTYGIWVGKKTNPTAEISGWTWSVSFYKANQSAATGISAIDTTHTFTVAVDGSTSVTIQNGMRSTITYQNCVDNGGTITGIVTATKS